MDNPVRILPSLYLRESSRKRLSPRRPSAAGYLDPRPSSANLAMQAWRAAFRGLKQAGPAQGREAADSVQQEQDPHSRLRSSVAFHFVRISSIFRTRKVGNFSGVMTVAPEISEPFYSPPKLSAISRVVE